MDLITRYRNIEKPRVVGLMSGTSADAIDAALVEIDTRAEKVKLLKFASTPLPDEVKAYLQDVFANMGTHREISMLSWLLGDLFAETALKVMDDGADLIASHGQTISHLPDGEMFLGRKVRCTQQIGEGAAIAAKTGCLTVCDFRPQDLAAGGQGAPLVPFADAKLFHSASVDRVALNVGGMANITWIPRQGEVEACDTGPGNALSDALAYKICGQSCDFGGKLAASGQVIPEILDELMSHPYLAKPLPKSTGREEFGREMALSLWGRGKPEDLVRTVIAFTAASVALHIERFMNGPCEVFIAGGGSENPVLMQELRSRLPQDASLEKMDKLGIPTQAREAVCFALLGHETMWGRPANVIGATGAKRRAVLGKIVMP